MKNCLILVTDKNYVKHIKSLIMQVRDIGGWDEDICVIFNNVNDSNIIKDFEIKGVIPFEVSFDNPFYAKYSIFNVFFKRWKNIIYMDADFVIKKNIKPLLKQVDNENMFLCDYENNNLDLCFTKNEEYDELNNKYKIDKTRIFNSGCMVYNTDIIYEETFNRLVELSEKLKKINSHTGIDGGTDQPILNIYFKDIVKQIKFISFHLKPKGGEVALHTCRWHAPWKDSRYLSHYTKYLNKW